LPHRVARFQARDRAVDALARGVDRDVVAAGDRPAREIVFPLLLDRYRARGRLEPHAYGGQSLGAIKRGRGRRQAHTLDAPELRERPGNALPFGLAGERFLRAVASGTEVEDLRVARVDAQRPLLGALMRADEIEIIVELDVAVRVTLKLLERDRIGP